MIDFKQLIRRMGRRRQRRHLDLSIRPREVMRPFPSVTPPTSWRRSDRRRSGGRIYGVWRSRSCSAADIILENIDEFARITTEESGKPFAQSKGEWLGAPNQLRWAAGEAERLYGRWIPSRMPGRRIDVIYQPIGVIGVITAWNFPVYTQMRAISSALAVGNTVVSVRRSTPRARPCSSAGPSPRQVRPRA